MELYYLDLALQKNKDFRPYQIFMYMLVKTDAKVTSSFTVHSQACRCSLPKVYWADLKKTAFLHIP